ncbi:hypothetical protein T484DRAFT_1785337 [Baffinella frigidus]|nr:hypothetical protein T484DRAFT_1785337 [Cryptophyta sp. CCMP2293]
MIKKKKKRKKKKKKKNKKASQRSRDTTWKAKGGKAVWIANHAATYDNLFQNITNNVALDPLDKAKFPSTKLIHTLCSQKVPDGPASEYTLHHRECFQDQTAAKALKPSHLAAKHKREEVGEFLQAYAGAFAYGDRVEVIALKILQSKFRARYYWRVIALKILQSKFRARLARLDWTSYRVSTRKLGDSGLSTIIPKQFLGKAWERREASMSRAAQEEDVLSPVSQARNDMMTTITEGRAYTATSPPRTAIPSSPRRNPTPPPGAAGRGSAAERQRQERQQAPVAAGAQERQQAPVPPAAAKPAGAGPAGGRARRERDHLLASHRAGR